MTITAIDALAEIFDTDAELRALTIRETPEGWDTIHRNKVSKLAYALARSFGYCVSVATALARSARAEWHQGESPDDCARRIVRPPSRSATDPSAA